MNIIDVTYLISEIYTNFHAFLCKKCVVGYHVINILLPANNSVSIIIMQNC